MNEVLFLHDKKNIQMKFGYAIVFLIMDFNLLKVKNMLKSYFLQ